VVKVGDVFEVKVISVDDQNRVRLSRKAVLLAKKSDAGGDDE
jgi:polyribonucleotide nucleotidyltransferase